jgi:nucleoside diphosphate kinase
VDYADSYTRESLLERRESGFVLIHPDGFRLAGEVFSLLLNAGLSIVRCKSVILSDIDCRSLYKSTSSNRYSSIITSVVNKLSLAVELIGPSCVPTIETIVKENPLFGSNSEKII